LLVIVGAAEVIAAVGADQLAVVSGKTVAAVGADLAVVIDGLGIGWFRIGVWDGVGGWNWTWKQSRT
jgi:hypothetical protein